MEEAMQSDTSTVKVITVPVIYDNKDQWGYLIVDNPTNKEIMNCINAGVFPKFIILCKSSVFYNTEDEAYREGVLHMVEAH